MRHMIIPGRTAAVFGLAAACALAACTVTGCETPAASAPAPASAAEMPMACTKTGPVVFVVSGRRDSPAPAVTGRMGSAITAAADHGSPLGIVDLDGSPRLIKAGRFSDPSAGNTTARDAARESFENGVAAAIAGTRARAPHADVLDALDVAGRAVHAACGHGGTIFVEDSGLQEIGPVDFRQPDLLAAVPQDVASFLARSHELPDLSGITVWLIGIGDTAPPQQRLSISQRRNLIAIWSAIIHAAGGTARVDATPRSGPAPAGVPTVLTVPVPSAPSWTPGPGAFTHVFADSGNVGFQPNLAVFRDPAAAQQTLRSLASYLIAHPSARILLIGTTAHWGSLAGCRQLSTERADAVRLVLIMLGAGAGQIRTEGLGWRFPGYVNDQAPGGGLLPGPAEHNRSVIVRSLA